MDVKDAQSVRSVTDVSIEGSVQQERGHQARSRYAPSSPRETVDSVTIHESAKSVAASTADVRTRANRAISAINLAADGAQEIHKLVTSIEGIVEQAAQDGTTPHRRAILEQEANQLVDAIRVRADQESDSGIKPLAGDKIRLEVERELGKTLEFILPDDAARAFDLGSIRFSPKEAILQTRTTVAVARRNIEALRNTVESVQKNVRGAVDTLEVALQNSEAANASIRDVDAALSLAGSTGEKIEQAPRAALESIGALGEEVEGLLK